jgi:sugar lactone lactonase YvrE
MLLLAPPLLLLLLLAQLPAGARAQCAGSTYSYLAAPTSCASCAPGATFVSSSLGCTPADAAAGGDDTAFSSGPADTVFFLSGTQAEGAAAFSAPAAAPAFTASHLAAPAGALALSAGGSYLTTPAAGSALALSLPDGGNAMSASAWYRCAPNSQPTGSASTLLDWGEAGNDAAQRGAKFSLQVSTPTSYSVATIAGGFTTANKIWADGSGTAAAFNAPMSMVYDASGTLWVADMLNCVIRTVSPTGVVNTAFGKKPVDSFVNGYADGAGNAARFYYPYGLAISSSGTVYVTDRSSQCVRAISSGVVSTVAGRCIGRTVLTVRWVSRPPATAIADGQGTSAVFVSPSGIALVGSALYVTDLCVIRKINLAASNTVTTWVGGACGAIVEASGLSARFGRPPLHLGQLEASNHLATDGVNLFMADKTNQVIVKIVAATGVLTRYSWGVIAPEAGPDMVTATTVGGPLYFTDYGTVYKVFPGGGEWAPLAGYAAGAAHSDANGVGTAAGFKGLNSVIVDASGNLVTSQNGYLSTIRRITLLPQPAPPCDGKWHHLAQTFAGNANFFDAGVMKIFLDGALFRTTSAALLVSSNMALRIGFNGNIAANGGDRFVGSVSDLRAYARELTPAEVLGLAQPPLPAFSNAIVTPSTPTAGRTAYAWTCAPGFSGTTQAWALATSTNTWTLTGGPVSCSSCVPGQFTVLGACSNCSAGTFSAIAGAAACTACAAGSTSTSGASSCTSCDPGYFATAGASACAACSSGTYGTSPPSGTCAACAAGSTSTPGATSCTACAPGFFAAAGAPDCTACPLGTYGTSPPSATCTACAANTYQNSVGATSVGACSACGQGVSEPGSSVCICPSGLFNTAGDAAASTCGSCPTGSYSYGSASCVLCSASAGASFRSSSLGCAPATGATDTSFFLSGRADEGIAGFAIVGAVANASFAPDFQNVVSGALALGRNAFLSTPSAAANTLASSLPAGNLPLGASAAAWARCAAEAQLPASAATILEWGVAGSAAAQPTAKFALTVAQMAQAPIVTVFAGGYRDPSGGYQQLLNGPAAKSNFGNSWAMAASPSAGFLYVATRASCIRKVELSTGFSSMFAGFDSNGPRSMDWASSSPWGYVDATGTNAKFYDLAGLAVHPSTGNVYVADVASQCLRAVTPGAVVSTLAGQCCADTGAGGARRFTCATIATGGVGTAATFLGPSGIALDPAGATLFVMDKCAVRKVDLSSRLVSGFAGGACGAAAEGLGAAAVFSLPPLGGRLWVPSNGVVADGRGNLFVADLANGRIRVVNMATAAVATFSAALAQPSQLAVSPADGLLYASDLATHKVYRILPGGAAVAVAGSGSNADIFAAGYVMGGAATAATLRSPRALAPLPNGNILMTDENNAILQINFFPDALPFCDSKWHHFALTFSGGSAGVPRIYVDGALFRTGTPLTFNLPTGSSAASALRVGWNGDLAANGGDTFIGRLADLRVYARQLTAAEVLTLSQPPLPAASASVVVTALAAGASKYVVACAAGFAAPPVTLARQPADLTWAGGPATAFGGCSQCAAGFFAPAGSAACLACPAGSYSLSAGSASCTPCGPNTYSSTVGASTAGVCLTCAGGGAYALGGAAACLCPAGTFLSSGDAAATTCSPCPARTYALGGALACATCPSGTTFVSASLGCKPTTSIARAPVDTAFFFSGAAAGALAVALVRNTSAFATGFVPDFMGAAGGALSLGADSASGAFLGIAPSLAPAALGSGSAALTLSARFNCAPDALGTSAGTLVEWGAAGSAAAQPTSKLALLASAPALRVVSTVLSSGLSSPQGMAFDPLGTTLYIADTNNHQLKALPPGGTLVTVAGSGVGPYPGGGGYLDAASALSARFNKPWGVAVAPSGLVYVVELENQCVRSYDPATGAVATIAGKGRGDAAGTAPRAAAPADGVGTNALFLYPSSLALDASGLNLYVADTYSIRRIVLATRVVTTFSGGGGPLGVATDGPGTSSKFNHASSITADPFGFLYVADYSSNMVRKVSMATGVTSTFALGVPGKGGRATAVAVDPATGSVYVADSYNNLLTSVGPGGGSRAEFSGILRAFTFLGGADGPVSSATFSSPTSLAVGADGSLYVLDSGAGWVRKVTLATSACDGKWHHLTAAFSSGLVKTYFDGSLSTTSSVSLAIPSGPGVAALRVGWNGVLTVNGGDVFPGAIADVRVFARAISDSEASQLALPPLTFAYSTSYALSSSVYIVSCAAGAFGPTVALTQSPIDGAWVPTGGSAVNCQQCGPGLYSAGGVATCSGTACPAGFVGPSGSITLSRATCAACSPGSWAAFGDAACTGTSCVPGTYGIAGASNASASACIPCVPGTYTSGYAANVCQGTPCAPGTFSNLPATANWACSSCASGQWSSSAGSRACLGSLCSQGSYGPSGSTSQLQATCALCPSGTYSSNDGATSCSGTICPANSFGPAGVLYRMSQPCSPCPAGMTSPPGATACTGNPCAPGRFGPSCALCAAGTWSSAAGAATCSGGEPCPAGSYGTPGATSAAQAACTPCPSGTWSSAVGAASCAGGSICSPGRYGTAGRSTAGSGSGCTACLPGTFSSSSGATTCATCAAGQYAPTSGYSSCLGTVCGAGTYALGGPTSNLGCGPCPSGTWSAAGAYACTGTLCAAGAAGPTGSLSAAAATCATCVSGTYSTAAGAGACAGTPCLAGFSGPLGSRCEWSAGIRLTCCHSTFRPPARPPALSPAGPPARPPTHPPARPPARPHAHPPARLSARCSFPFRAAAAAATCTACASGLFKATSGSSACDAGVTGGVCPRGSFGPIGETSAAAATCALCAPGTYTSSGGLGACTGTPCALGYYGTEGMTYASGCSSCASGQFTIAVGQTTCLGSKCPPGSVGPLASTSAAAAICTPCPAGMSISYAGASACIGTAAPAGYFGPTNVSDSTLATYSRCPSGTFSNATGLGACFGTPCPPGSYGPEGSTTAGAATCSLCPSGTYTSVSGSGICVGAPSTNCPLGFSGPLGSTSLGAATCTVCQPGTYASATGSGACLGTLCAAGTWGYNGSTNVASYTSKCLPCASGTYSGEGATACIGDPCNLGSFGPLGSTSAANATCTPCLAGTSNPSGTGLAKCGSGSLCRAGFYGATNSSAWGGSPCFPCVAGTYSSELGSSACAGTPCAPGSYGPARSTSAAAATCSLCPAGTFAASSGTTTCSGTPCPAGSYSSAGTGATSASSASCISCAAGQYSTASGSTSCLGTLCSPGTFGPSSASTAARATCTACGPGTFSNASGLSACFGSPCAAGQFGSLGATTSGNATCAPCPGGTYSLWPGSSSCRGTPCAAGYYSPIACSAQGCRGDTQATYPYCAVCPPGTYSSGTGSVACVGTVCPAGQFGPSGQSSPTSCTLCQPGTYSAASGSTFCYGSVCAAGYSGPAGATSQAAATCTACAAGTYSSAPGSTSCTSASGAACSPGTYSGVTAATSAAAALCQPCPSGTYSAGFGAQSCAGTICALGSYGTAGSSAANTCTLAPSGTFVNTTGATAYIGTPCAAGSVGPLGRSTAAAATCTLCAPGLHTSTAGLGPTCSGTLCAAGTFAATGAIAAVTCSNCSAGSFTSSTGQSACSFCGGGLFQPAAGQSSCLQCSAGSYALAGVPGGNQACTPCAEGTASSASGVAACGTCAAGSYQNATGATSCISCAAGTFQALPRQVNCSLCAPGSFAAGTGSQSCTPAGTNKYVPNSGSTSQLSCAAGSVASGGAAACRVCPMGSYTSGSDCPLCQGGTYSTIVGASGGCAGNCLYTSMGSSSCAYTGSNNDDNSVSVGAVARSAAIGVSFFGTVGGYSAGRIVGLTEGSNSTLTITGELVLASVERPVASAAAAPDFRAAFFGIGSSPGKVVQINVTLPMPSKTLATLTFNSGENKAACLALDSGRSFLYVGTATTPAFIVQVAVAAASAPVRAGSLLLSGGAIAAGSSGATSVGALVAAAIDLAGGFAYFVSGGAAPALVARLELVVAAAGIAAAQVSLLALPASYGAAAVALIDSSFLYVAAGPATLPVLVRIVLGNYSALDAIALVDPAGTPDGLVLAGTWGPASAPSLLLTFAQVGSAAPRLVLVNTTPAAPSFARAGAIAYTAGFPSYVAVSASDAVGGPHAYAASGFIGWRSEFVAIPLSLCPAGSYSSGNFFAGRGSCTQCPAGTYSSDGAVVCVPCPAGTVSTAVGASSVQTCVACPLASYATAGSTSCSACPARPGTVGTYAVANLVAGTNLYLYSCGAGSSQNFTNVTTACDITSGAFSSPTPTPLCPACPPGTFSTAGASNCTACPGGTANPNAGGASCTACPAGWAAAPGSASCFVCGPGSWTSSSGTPACSTCVAGSSFPGYGAQSGGLCAACAAGSASVPGVSACAPCARGYYSAAASSSTCTPCSRGTTTLTTGATGCIVPDTATLTVSGASTANPPGAVAYDSVAGIAYVALPALSSVVAVGAYLTAAPAVKAFSSLGNPAGLALYGAGYLLVADAQTGTLWVVNLATGSKIAASTSFAKANATTGDAGLVGVCVDAANGTVYLLESRAAASGSRVLAVSRSSVSAVIAAFVASRASPDLADVTVLAESGNGTGSLLGAAPASIAFDPDAPGGATVLIGNASGAILAVPASGADATVAWAALPQAFAASTLLVDLPTRSLYVVQAASGAVLAFLLDSAAVATTLAGLAGDAGGLAIDLISGQLLYASALSGNLTVAFPCDSASAGTGFLQPCAPTACDAGSASITAGFCVSCTAGSFSAYLGASACALCPEGSFSAGPSSASCTACPAGLSTIGAGASSASSCVACPAGSFVGAGGACALCAPGSYSASAGATFCTPCPPGSAVGQPGASSAASCLWCPTSTAGYGFGAATCLHCNSSTPALQAAASMAVASSACGVASYANSVYSIYSPHNNFNFAPLAVDAELGYVFLGQTDVNGANYQAIVRAQLGSSSFHANRGTVPLERALVYLNFQVRTYLQRVTIGVMSQARRTLLVGTTSKFTTAPTGQDYSFIAAYGLTTATVDGFAQVAGSPLMLSTGESSVTSLLTDDVFAYASTNAGTLVKVRISGLVRNVTLNLASSISAVGAAVIDVSAGVAYYASSSTGGAVAKVNLTTMSVIASATLGFTAGAATALLNPSRSVLILHLKTCPVQLVWISTESLSVIGRLTLQDLCTALPMVYPPNGEIAADGTSLVAAAFSGSTTAVRNLAVVSVNITSMAQSSAAVFTGVSTSVMPGVVGDAANGAVYFPSGTSSLQAVQVTGGVVLPYHTVTAGAVSPANGAAADAANLVTYVPVAQSLARVRVIGGVPRVTATLAAVAPASSTMGACGLDAAAQMLYCGYTLGTATYLARVAVNASSFSNSTTPQPPMALTATVTAFATAAVTVRVVITDPARGFVYAALRDGANDRLQRFNFTAGALTLNRTLTFASGSGPACGFVDSAGLFAYFGAYSGASGAQVIRVALSNFTSTTLALNTSNGPALGCTYDAANGLGYFTTSITSGAFVSTVDLASFALVGSPLVLPSSTAFVLNSVTSAAPAVSNGVFALGCKDSGGFVYVVYLNAPAPPGIVSFASRQMISATFGAGVTPAATGITNLIPDWSTTGGNEMQPPTTYLATFATASASNMVSLPAVPCAAGSVYVAGLGCSLCPAGSWSGLGSPACVACAPGTFSEVVGAASAATCAACGAGYTSSSGAVACVSCAAGTFSAAGSPFCAPCNAGTSSPTVGPAACTSCSAGTFAPFGASSCAQCPAGSFSAAGASACTTCPGGYACAAGSTSTSYTTAGCPAGSFAAAGSPACSTCPPGTISRPLASSCSSCLAGTYSPLANQTGIYNQFSGTWGCSMTPPGGYIAAGAGATTFTACPAGTFTGTSTSNCNACPAGNVAPNPATSICSACNGYGYYFVNATSPCQPCKVGTYAGFVGTGNPCLACSTGVYCPNTAMQAGLACPAGSFCPTSVTGNVAPIPCPGNTSMPTTGNSNAACTNCTGGLVAVPGSTSCIAPVFTCPFNTYWRSDYFLCAACPSNAYCLGGFKTSFVVCAPGSVPPGWALNASGACAPCAVGSYCPGSAASGGLLDNVTIACPAGQSTPAVGAPDASHCLPLCAPGSFLNTTTGACSNCAPGSISPGGVNVTACTQCASRSVTTSLPRTACTACAAGFLAVNGTTCFACPTHTYQNGTQCTPCPPGSDGSAWNATRGPGVPASSTAGCAWCPNVLGISNLYVGGPCGYCPSGWIGKISSAALAGGETCRKCLAGTIAVWGYPSSCSPCGPQFLAVQPADAATSCIGCGPGTYAASAYPSTCTPCPANTFSSASATSGPTSCAACSSGYFSAAGALSCAPCPAGTYATSSVANPCSEYALCS